MLSSGNPALAHTIPASPGFQLLYFDLHSYRGKSALSFTRLLPASSPPCLSLCTLTHKRLEVAAENGKSLIFLHPILGNMFLKTSIIVLCPLPTTGSSQDLAGINAI